VVGDQVVQGEAVVTGHKVHALLRLALLVPVNLGAANEAIDKAGQRTLLAPEEAADVITKTPVPFFPAISDEASDLIETGGIPCLRNQFRASESRIGFDIPQHGRIGQDPTGGIAREDRSKIEPEP